MIRWPPLKLPQESGYHTEIQRVVNNTVLYHLMSLAANKTASGQVRAIIFLKLDELKHWLAEQVKEVTDENQKAHYMFAASQINRFQKDPKEINVTKPVTPPAGAPIG